MNIKLDENVPADLREPLVRLGHNVDSVEDEGLRGHADVDVWQAAQADQRFLVTQDLDFSDARRYRPGTHHGILIVRLREPTRRRLIERLSAVFRQSDLRSWEACLVVLSDGRVRVRRPA